MLLFVNVSTCSNFTALVQNRIFPYLDCACAEYLGQYPVLNYALAKRKKGPGSMCFLKIKTRPARLYLETKGRRSRDSHR